MKIFNTTSIDAGVLEEYAGGCDTQNLRVFIKDTRKGSYAPYSGVCYYREGRIRVSVNPRNLYPVPVRVGSPFRASSWNHYFMKTPEDLMSFVFLHELSHYLDFRNGIPVRCKQTKADMFALKRMGFVNVL